MTTFWIQDGVSVTNGHRATCVSMLEMQLGVEEGHCELPLSSSRGKAHVNLYYSGVQTCFISPFIAHFQK